MSVALNHTGNVICLGFLIPKFRNCFKPHLLRLQDLVSHQLVGIILVFVFACCVYWVMCRLDVSAICILVMERWLVFLLHS